jgi:hypothetical protein
MGLKRATGGHIVQVFIRREAGRNRMAQHHETRTVKVRGRTTEANIYIEILCSTAAWKKPPTGTGNVSYFRNMQQICGRNLVVIGLRSNVSYDRIHAISFRVPNSGAYSSNG